MSDLSDWQRVRAQREHGTEPLDRLRRAANRLADLTSNPLTCPNWRVQLVSAMDEILLLRSRIAAEN